jgi:hypothetical protein
MTTRPELPRIRSVKPRQHYKLEIQWEHGETSVIDMKGIISAGGVFDALRDADFFSTVSLGDRGRYIEWKDPINRQQVVADFDADSLIRLADQQQTSSSLEKLVKAVRNRLVHGSGQPT